MPVAPQINDGVTSSHQASPNSISQKELIIGKGDAKAVIIEYGDFKCPSCNQFHHHAGKQLRDKYVSKGTLKIVFRNLPFIGPDSYRAAEGAYCANEQNKFVDYHDTVYNYIWDNYYSKGNLAAEFENVLTQAKLVELAGGVGADKAAFETCLAERRYDSAVKADLKASEKDVATGTPFFVINNQTIAGPQPYNVFKTLVDIQLR